MKLAIIKDGIVENIINADRGFAPDAIEVTSPISIGDSYDGVKFMPKAPVDIEKYLKRFKADRFVSDVLTGQEFDALVLSINSDIKRIIKRLTTPNRNAYLNVEDQEFKDIMNLATSLKFFSRARHVEIMKGIPL